MKIPPLLESILTIPSESGDCDRMIEFLSRYADSMKWLWRLDETGNLYVTTGKSDTFPCVCAHVDTVHRIEPGGIAAVILGHCITGINPSTMEQTGIGGDDKCGIYAALRCLHELPACKAAFFVDEEIGCRGSQEADITFFKDCRFVLQADRRGNKDFVTDISGPLSSKAFRKACHPFLKQYGFTPCSGMMTDVEALRDNQAGVSVANMSAGYYNPHMSHEFIVLPHLENTVNLVLALCRNLTKVYEFTWTRPPVVWKQKWTWSKELCKLIPYNDGKAIIPAAAETSDTASRYAGLFRRHKSSRRQRRESFPDHGGCEHGKFWRGSDPEYSGSDGENDFAGEDNVWIATQAALAEEQEAEDNARFTFRDDFDMEGAMLAEAGDAHLDSILAETDKPF